MKIVLFYHSLVSDWNHGNAHFLRGVVRELIARGHEAVVCEPRDGWSRTNLLAAHGPDAVAAFARAFPELRWIDYDLEKLDLDVLLDDADLVIVHEWTSPTLIGWIGKHRIRSGRHQLLFHDTHHRAVSAPQELTRLDLDGYDGVLAFGEVVRELYLLHGWTHRAWTWHEAADLRLFRPIERVPESDLVWIGNWGDDERSAEIQTFLLDPIRDLGLAARIFGVRYPNDALTALAAAGASYGGWLPNHRVPETFSRFDVTVHVPRRPYTLMLPGIPTIRVFEALACGIPLVSAPWQDVEGLFTPGDDFLMVQTGAEMRDALLALRHERDLADRIAAHGLRTVRERHSCAHRVDELLAIWAQLSSPERPLARETAAAGEATA